MKRIALSMLLVGSFLLSACAARSAQLVDMDKSYAAEAPAMPMSAPSPSMEMADSAGSNAYSSGESTSQSIDRIVIKNASLSIVVADPNASMDAIASLADEYSGWVVSSNLYKTTTSSGIEIPRGSISIRVPAEKLNQALAAIKGMVEDPETDIQSENVSGEDVTAQYTDLQSRKANLEQAEASLREIMASATKTEDVLNVFNQLTQVRGEIEVIRGQIKYYEESSSFSAISVELISKASIEPITVAGWKPQGVARDALQALINAGKVLVNIAIWFAIFVLPILLVFYLVIRFFIWVIKKLFFRKKNPPVAPEEPAAVETKSDEK